MITLHPTKDEGATAHPGPLHYVDPEAVASPSPADILAGLIG